uniref:CUB domain-containing protein n=1 Tax=Acrobeloides nanus TaxID=290746 RepID=A0A914E8W0_9BILA
MINGDGSYCEKMNCNWTITYSVDDMILQIYSYLSISNDDYLSIKTLSGAQILNVSGPLSLLNPTSNIFTSDKQLYVNFISGTQTNSSGWLIILALIKNDPQNFINLTSDSSTSLLTLNELQLNSPYNIMVEDGTLDLFVSTLYWGYLQRYFHYVDVFNGTGLYWDNYLGTLYDIIQNQSSLFDGFSSTQLKPITLNYPLTIIRKKSRHNDTLFMENWLLLRIRDKHAVNCPDTNNVFKIYSTGMTIDYTARQSGDCILTVLCLTGLPDMPKPVCKLDLSGIRYTGNGNLIGARGLSNKTEIFNLNSQSTSAWTDLTVYANPFSFIIPSNGQIHVNASAEYDFSFGNTINCYPLPQNGILMSPQYPYANNPNLMENSTLTTTYLIAFTPSAQFELTFISLDLKPNSFLKIYDYSNVYLNLNGTQGPIDKKQIISENLTISYAPGINVNEKGFLISYSVVDTAVHTTPSSSDIIRPLNIFILFLLKVVISNFNK